MLKKKCYTARVLNYFGEGETMASRIFVFFNCDEAKNESTMNINYNNVAYKDTTISRKRLFQKIESERNAGRVQIAEENLSKVEKIIMSGDPVDASELITYGAIKKLNCV